MAQHTPPALGRIKIVDPATESPFTQNTYDNGESHMHCHSQSTILNTRENLQAVVEMFAEHVEFCSEPFKEEILKKVNELKGRDHKLLTSFVSRAL